ncbi:MAG: hypothetical protein COC14_07865 [Burkholderiaceae bacterium]|uniref:Uncharacterized protein n=1 Tax=Cupriavidus metallidurans TaxID=119219 RepID=A0A482J2J3_9BURK|nr:MAG: hypothetical protein COC14_07865 [Burkholderiaceae bacterium]QBP13284.1 hypothetical protein DDF84_026995 [Cupriavidus metallidurans]
MEIMTPHGSRGWHVAGHGTCVPWRTTGVWIADASYQSVRQNRMAASAYSRSVLGASVRPAWPSDFEFVVEVFDCVWARRNGETRRSVSAEVRVVDARNLRISDSFAVLPIMAEQHGACRGRRVRVARGGLGRP